MQASLVNALVAAVVRFWPTIEPLLIKAATKVARTVIQKARDGEFPEKWKFLEPIFDGAADELLKALPAE